MSTHESERKASQEGIIPSEQDGDEKNVPEAPQSFLVDWNGDKDPLNPRSFSPCRKWFYVAVVSQGSLLVQVPHEKSHPSILTT